ncbi:MAG: bifunctional phosphoribosylaminoimidazolecarboxamide formyltransferase/inosine monophosphate cyclohydrolase [Bacteroidetes bacterium QS_9_68_14]|nr:MAG: bifunctional phosphoribosylaminoimidazolecarboxamide formyltransferase/inosine monophosphate cyclohydrolase [Bacteroidetes bacterium QS_9_68_14]
MVDPDDTPSPGAPPRVRRALLSVYDKTGVADFAQRLDALDVELISTGGTAETLREAGLDVTDVAELTGFPEVLGGRVKSVHSAVHAGLLARRGHEGDADDLDAHGLVPIDLVACNLYPFEEALSQSGADDATATANIDIGGPAMLRAAAKNFFRVAAVCDPASYDAVAAELEENESALSSATRRRLAGEAFAHTARYDRAIAGYFSEAPEPDAAPEKEGDVLPETLSLSLPRAAALRYGENPHQAGALYGNPSRHFEKLHGKTLSYNNLNDLSAALHLIDEFRDDEPTCAILKHTNPTGMAVAPTLEAAYQRAFSTDRQSPFGGIVVVNRPLDRATAEAIDRIFTEIIIAPAFEEGVLGFLQEKERRRVVRIEQAARTDRRPDVRSVVGGLLVQERDPVLLPGHAARSGWEVPTERAPSEREERDLAFAWRVAKHVKSNAIVYAQGQATLGIGAGQMSRLDASELAVRKGQKAELDFEGAVIASDAFFPFADGLEAAARAGATAAIQPGGSIRDEEVVSAADEAGVAMICTGHRHFRH